MSVTIEELAARLGRLEDVEAARGFFHTYAETLDVPDPATVAALFAVDGKLHTPMGSFEGRDAIEKFYGEAFAADTSLKRHFLANAKSESLEPGVVRLQSYFLYVGRGDDASIIGWGTYDDTIDVSGESPLFVEKTIEVHMGTTLDQGWAK
ncbi:SnoaL-like protein [Nocardioides sp. J9]|uniref:nuclear transport factor 2 family protein n=1 Tax=unclassified Nocardioides TaxID=2615069 RepID=UPI0004909FC7|nr:MULTISPECIES: nuclear transport factor 2 family protein [unclassified Nocardioides]TWG96343.1 SnoaL-like protein [Nocardioides sp. J9]